jgi:hypothetical protein
MDGGETHAIVLVRIYAATERASESAPPIR